MIVTDPVELQVDPCLYYPKTELGSLRQQPQRDPNVDEYWKEPNRIYAVQQAVRSRCTIKAR